ncbi:MAG TPA: acetate kinase [Bryobacteraceae bacterium]|jgi:acetate kinase|nr:acetate kinase [Bryobacteraceae bacterium]
MKILVLNAGSSSLKFNLFDITPESIAGNSEQVLAKGEIERVAGMAEALRSAFGQIGTATVDAVGHRVVHGGDRFHESVIIDAEVERQIEELSALAPLHNPPSLEAFRAAREHLPDVPHVAAFDTAFHHTLPPRSYVYGLPYEYLTEKKIRRYGFHGISHRYVSGRFAQLHGGKRSDYRMIVCHLGNGCSVCAIGHGHSIDTSMGFTPLEGLVMGTRSGDLDAGAVLHLITQERHDPASLLQVLNRESGLKGISGISNDMRDLEREAGSGNERAALAIEVFCYRVRKYIGAYLAAMNGADALIFTGGIGENSPAIRARICQELGNLGIAVDAEANEKDSPDARAIGGSKIPVWVVPTNEELTIARDTLCCVQRIP